MNFICIMNFWESIFTGLLSNFLFTLFFIFLFQQIRYWYYLKRKFHNVTFNVYWKRFPNDIVYTVECKVTRNRIKITGKNKNSDIFEGEFIINPFNLKTGEGFHSHKDSDGFAFLKIIIKDNDTFLVDAPYTKVNVTDRGLKIGDIVYQAFIWRKQ